MRFFVSFSGVTLLAAALLVVPVSLTRANPTTAFVSQTLPTDTPAAATGRSTVLVLPFEVIGEDATNRAWLGRAVQQNLLAELSRVQTLQPVSTSAPASATSPQGLSSTVPARFVISGTVQSVGNDLRITGQIFDASTQTVLTGLKATGSSRELFSMQDTLATQASRALPQPVAKQPAVAPVTAPQLVAPAPVRVAVDEREFIGSELDRAVRQGYVNSSNAIDVSDARYNYIYGQSRWGYPVYGGYGGYGYNYPIVIIRDRDCYRSRWNLDVNFGGGNFNGHITTGRPTPIAPFSPPVMPPVLRGPNTVGYYPMTMQSSPSR